MSLSRIGKQPVPVPPKVQVSIDGAHIAVKGPLGQQERTLKGVSLAVQDGQIVIEPVDGSRVNRALHGLARSLINNMVIGVTTGFTRELEINGVGYRAEAEGNILTLTLGFSHPVVYPMPKGVEAAVERQTRITLKSIDKELLGRTAAKVRSFRPPEPYKGKGIKYVEETIQRKVGKSA